ncbi:hypothetical protein [Zunongwangia sp. HGR-M22]|uniref:hypothetical protein n=1 Tax=Zunongwangia sp. HGR-M22 TaxID=3015168 RepID=UPI0022DD5AB0|nr:hypothetical protein [Zunongwangia sp. HGR-M22]WBL24261.1 hypothetical protein PBT91_10060 [Zunongwangia sp. HGR-M22]
MKPFYLILFFGCFISNTNGQKYHSKTTAHIKKVVQVEFIERDIEIKEKQIVITSYDNEKIDIQTLNILAQGERDYKNSGICIWYRCNTRGLPDTEKLILIPKDSAKFNQIEIFQYKDNEIAPEEIKFLIDK